MKQLPFVLVIIILLGFCVYLQTSKKPIEQKLETTQTELTLEKAAFTELCAAYDEVSAQLEQQHGIQAELDWQIDQQLQQLAKQKDEIANLIRDKKFEEAKRRTALMRRTQKR
jgi:uncharacterized protein YozE (UPF0346 family)